MKIGILLSSLIGITFVLTSMLISQEILADETSPTEQPGVMASPTPTSPPSAAGQVTQEEKTTTTEKEISREAKNVKSCVDENGVTHLMGEKGYKNCLKAAAKKKHPEAMGGQKGSASSSPSE